MTSRCKECSRPFSGSQQRKFCCSECVAIYRIKKSSEARERSRKPWEPVEEEPCGDTDDFITPTPFGDPTV